MNTEKLLATMTFKKEKRVSIYELSEIDFETEREKTIFNEIKENIKAEPQALGSILSQKNLIDITEFAAMSDSEHFESILDDVKAQARKKIGKHKIIQLMHEFPNISADELHKKLLSIANEVKTTEKVEYVQVGDAMDKAMDGIEKERTGLSEKIKIPFMEGLLIKQNGSELNIIGGRPSMGKTAFMLNMAERFAMNKTPVGILSYEMSAEEIVLRMLQKYWNKSLMDEAEKLTDEEYKNLEKQKNNYKKLPMYLSDKTNASLSYCLNMIDQMAKIDGVKVFFIDYLQLMNAKGYTGNRTLEIGAITRALKVAAMENNVIIMLGSQLSRAVEMRENKRPTLSDLRESGAIEQDANNVMFIYRDEYYQNNPDTKGQVDIIVEKQRNGKLGTRTLAFSGERQMITELPI